jgi:RNA polymerase sigma factor (sigma-70 family)
VFDTRDCEVPGCTLEAEPARSRCSEHYRDELEVANLLRTYAPLVRKIVSALEHPEKDEAELESIAMLALWEAVRNFRLRHGVRFESFLRLVLSKRLHDAGVKAKRQKNLMVTYALREVRPEAGQQVFRREMLDVFEVLVATTPSPYRVACARDDLSHVIHDMNFVLTDAERTAIRGVLNERTYDEIALEMGGDRRTVDNAVQRGRRKLAAALA